MEKPFVITGAMRSGKSYMLQNIASKQGGYYYSCTQDTTIEHLRYLIKASKVICIDELQFIDYKDINLGHLVEGIDISDKEIFLSFLLFDYLGHRFKSTRTLVADIQLYGVCELCGCPSIHNARRKNMGNDIIVVDKDIYVSLCHHCYDGLTVDGVLIHESHTQKSKELEYSEI